MSDDPTALAEARLPCQCSASWIEKYPDRHVRGCPAAHRAVVADALRTHAETVARPLRCAGCGSSKSIEEIMVANPAALSCCPERKMLDIDQWRERAETSARDARRKGVAEGVEMAARLIDARADAAEGVANRRTDELSGASGHLGVPGLRRMAASIRTIAAAALQTGVGNE